jgi:enoyl-CoA hydratase/carnithine racemase
MPDSAVKPAPLLLRDHIDRVLLLTLNRPEARNALNRALLEELNAAIEAAEGDADVGAIVLTGSGTAFCAGADLKETAAGMEHDDFWARYARANQSLSLHKTLPKLSKPVIASVNGFALAGGCGVAMSCDLVIASDQAKFGYPEVKRGLVAAMVMVSLSRYVGKRQALDLLLTGRQLSAEEALELGMINRVVPHAQLRECTLEYAASVAANSASALRMTKALFHQVSELDYDRALDYARDVNQMMRQTRDAREGARAFGHKEAVKGDLE